MILDTSDEGRGREGLGFDAGKNAYCRPKEKQHKEVAAAEERDEENDDPRTQSGDNRSRHDEPYMFRLALLNSLGGHIGYLAHLASYAKKAMIRMIPMINGASTCVEPHSY
jgi:hypothetical protein